MRTNEYASPSTEDTATAIVSRPCPALGAILVESGRLDPDATTPILQVQEQEGCLFGEAAIKLGFLTAADVEQALARQFDYDLPGSDSPLHPHIAAAYHPHTPQVEELRRLRASLSVQLFDCHPLLPTLAISSAEPGEGKSVLAANLGVLFAQTGKRTLIVDADLRHPTQHQLFGLSNRIGLTNILAARSSIDVLQSVDSIKGLMVLTAGALPPNPQELLARPLFPLVLSELSRQFDVILIDTPAHAAYGDAQLIARHAKRALILARNNRSRAASLQALATDLARADVQVVGAVMNKF